MESHFKTSKNKTAMYIVYLYIFHMTLAMLGDNWELYIITKKKHMTFYDMFNYPENWRIESIRWGSYNFWELRTKSNRQSSTSSFCSPVIWWGKRNTWRVMKTRWKKCRDDFLWGWLSWWDFEWVNGILNGIWMGFYGILMGFWWLFGNCLWYFTGFWMGWRMGFWWEVVKRDWDRCHGHPGRQLGHLGHRTGHGLVCPTSRVQQQPVSNSWS